LIKVLARHSELEQSETKAQGTLVTILSLTQITELKLLFDIGRQGHQFYDLVLSLLIACISLEIFVGMIIIYIGNLHYYQSPQRHGWYGGFVQCLVCCCRACAKRKTTAKKKSTYASVGGNSSSALRVEQATPTVYDDVSVEEGCCDWDLFDSQSGLALDIDRVESALEVAKVKVADADVKIVRASNYFRVVEDAMKKNAGNVELEHELVRSRDDLSSAMRDKQEAEAEQKLAEAHAHHMFFIKEQREDRQERSTFRKIAIWQHMATYLLYFVMLMNVFITTFGISGGATDTVFNTNVTFT
jgi:hypothetical protein